jgi:hypothetical protein
MPEPTLATTQLPTPRGYQLTIPDSASFPLRDLDTAARNLIARILRRTVVTLRARPANPMDACLNRSTCRPGNNSAAPCCLLCGLDLTVVTIAQRDGGDPSSLLLHGSIAKQLALDTIDANPDHGGEVFVLTYLADNVHTLTEGTPR